MLTDTPSDLDADIRIIADRAEDGAITLIPDELRSRLGDA
jgi:hypothetical protein